ncbi:MAG: binding-protein-dependent transport system inner rane component [Solirubrobacterales bacterium]|jgi:peptide/nickel transport system permease protein|nr:binding-protein-dependent transport system inner rane component [Solirubrobacterales bacterium]
MARFIIRRLLWVVALLFFVSLITFIVFYLLPSTDPALLRAGRQPNPELVQTIREQLGLDKSKPEQFYLYMKGVFLHFDFGTSYEYNAPVKTLMFDRLPATMQLAAGGVVLWLLAGISVGIVSAARRRSFLDRFAMSTSLVLVSAPVYFLGLVALYLFANDVGKFPLLPGYDSYVAPSDNLGKWFASMIMPWIVIASTFAAIYARLLRGSLIEVLSEDYIRTARAKGLTERRVILRHGVRSAITPIVTVLGLDVGILLGGAILTESVFNIPGIGRLAYDAISRSDLPTIQGTVLLGAFFIVIGTLLVDIAYAFIDPRVRIS